MRKVIHLAWVAAAFARPAVAGGEERLQVLLTEGYEFKVAVERFVILQRPPALLGGGAADAYLCPVDSERVLHSLRDAVCEPLRRPDRRAAR